MRVDLIRISIENFGGVKSEAFTLSKNKNIVTGANEAGKSTVFNEAPIWCLTGRDRYGDAKFQFKPVNKTGELILGLNTVVECEYSIDGVNKSFTRISQEKYSKDNVYQDNEFAYKIDQFPVTATEFKTEVDKLFNSTYFKVLTSLNYFFGMHWEKQREFLVSVFPQTENSKLASEIKGCEWMAGYLEKHKVSDLKRNLKEELKKLDSSGIESKISENELKRNNIDFSNLKTILAQKQDDLKKVNLINSSIQERISSELSKLSDKKNKMLNLISDKDKVVEKKTADVLEEYEKDCALYKENTSRISSIKNQIESNITEAYAAENRRNELESLLVELKAEKAQKKAEVFSLSIATCQHGFAPCVELNDHHRQNMIEAKEFFYQKQVEAIASINQTGKRTAAELLEINNRLKSLSENISYLKDELAKIQLSIKETPNKPIVDLSQDAECLAIEADIKQIQKELETSSASESTEDTTHIQAEIASILFQLEKEKDNENIDLRTNELRAEQLKISSKQAEINKQLASIDEFVKHKMQDTETNINSTFKNIQFKMFKTNKEGNIENTCEMSYKGVPYQRLSSSRRVKTAMEFISTCQSLLDNVYPLVIDDAELTSVIPDKEGQLIIIKISEHIRLNLEQIN